MISMNLLSKDTKQLKLQLNSEFQIGYPYKLTSGFQGITHVYQSKNLKTSYFDLKTTAQGTSIYSEICPRVE